MTRKKRDRELTIEEYKQLFDRHVKVDEDSGCYLWQAAKNNIGYGFFRYKNGMATAHRVAMDLEGHNIQGKIVYHTCDNYHCVNPQHLKIGTLYDKAKVMTDKGHSGTTFTNPKYFIKCPHCGKSANPAVYGHVHGDKCKQKPQ